MNGSKTLERALDILFILAERETFLSVKEIASKASIPESTTYRFLQTLEKNGIIEREEGKIKLGLRILELARVLYQQIDRELDVIAKPTMEKLTEEIGETSLLTVRTGLKIMCIQQIESKRLIRMAVNKGRTLPLHQGASGKAILAFENQQVLNRIEDLINEKERYKKLKEELDVIQKNGFSMTVGEVDQDITGIAAPIFDRQNGVIASLSIVGPKSRIDENFVNLITNATVQAADEISRKLQQIVDL